MEGSSAKLPTNQHSLGAKGNMHTNLYEEHGSGMKTMQNLNYQRMIYPIGTEKTFTDPKITLNTSSPDTGFRFDMTSSNSWKYHNREKMRSLKDNSFSNESSSRSSSNVAGEFLDDSYQGLFSDQLFEKSNLAFSPHFYPQSTTSFNEVINFLLLSVY